MHELEVFCEMTLFDFKLPIFCTAFRGIGHGTELLSPFRLHVREGFGHEPDEARA